MPSRARISQVTRVQRALKVALDDEARASSVLTALGQLSPSAVTFDERDTLLELQLAALGFCEAIREDLDRQREASRFFEAWFAFDTTWANSPTAG